MVGVRDEPIAVIGLSCRLPKASSGDELWQLFEGGVDAVSEAPPDRWDHDSLPVRRGGFLDRVDLFDAGFFGVSPREAMVMDPQQRLLLELSWEALENARLVPGDLAGSRTGVFAGTISADYATLLDRHGVEAITPHTNTGLSRGIIANRISYTLGLRGPSLTVDTAQSSSLVSVQLACESLRQGQSDLAIAGGVNLNILPETTISVLRFGGLSPDGRCFTFDERANGYVRGEGGGLVVLKPLSRALADDDRIYCVIAGGATNNDGATDGLTVPGQHGQEEVLRLAQRAAGVDPSAVQYVELHGTGTRIGDPVEAHALGAVLGRQRPPDDPLVVGSAKTNVGHLEGAAGIVGLLKVALSIAHRRIPPSLNFRTPHQDIPLDELRIRVQTELGAWPRPDAPLTAGVSSFGMGGTNCHLVVTEPPAPHRAVEVTDRPEPTVAVPLLLSARTRPALRAQAARLLSYVDTHADLAATDVAFTLATARTRFEHGAAVVATGRDELLAGLSALATGKPAPGLVETTRSTGGLAFVFASQGSHRLDMARGLYDAFPAFARAFDAVCAELDPTRHTQTAVFAVEVALYRLLESWGVLPDVVTGHAMGEWAAAHVTGALSLVDACRLVGTHERPPAQFRADSVTALYEQGVRTFLALGPDGSLTDMALESLDDTDAAVVPIRCDQADDRTIGTAVATLSLRGVPVNWAAVLGPDARLVDLPGYAFQRERHWISDTRPAEVRVGAAELSSLELVRANAAAVLGHAAADAVDTGRTFKDLGFDSVLAVELSDRLTKATGLRLPAGLLFDYPTPTALAHHLRAELSGTHTPVTTTAAAALDEPIAIVGMGCRLPGGVTSPDELWRLVASGTDAIGEFPTNRRWDLDRLYDPDPDKAGATYTRHGGFLYDADQFDPEFFGISPREATAMDPQQRLLLETSWEALERAGITMPAPRGSQVGVFVGAMAQDYGPRLHEAAAGFDGYLLTGATVSVASGRIAYALGLEGPAVTVDTACSSSLVALHLACQALRQGECTVALAGGVTVMATPGMFVEFSRQRGLSRDGRCRSFAASADGTGWGEGAGILVLQRLSDAQREQRPILAVVRGSAVNQDGASNGLTAPNGPSQERVIRQALANARLTPSDVDAVEAHGTGTTLGDPIEAQALLATYGQDRDRPLWLGSVKSNIGHTQAAAGVASLIKMVMAMRHGTLPRTLHVDQPTPHVDWSAGAVSLLTDEVPWPETERPRRAGISSFGISGTNAHVILEQPPEKPAARTEIPDSSSPLPFHISAKTAATLRTQAQRLLSYLDSHPEVAPASLAAGLAHSRTRFDHRAVILGATEDDLRHGLTALATGQPAPNLIQGIATPDPKPVFVFPGQGSQWPGMGLDLLDTEPVFRDHMMACADALAPHVDWHLLDILNDDAALARVDVVQPALFAVMTSLAALWRSHGIEPAAVIGHSQGEIAAAYTAGALTLDDAATITALRSKTLTRLADTGGMMSVPLPPDIIEADFERFPDLHIAAHNSPTTTIVAGDTRQLHQLHADYASRDIRARVIDVDYASHTPHIEQLQPDILHQLAHITPQPATIPFYSTLIGAPLDTTRLTADYWYQNLRNPVQFHHTIHELIETGHHTFVETSPHPVLTHTIHQTTDNHTVWTTGTLKRDHHGPTQFRHALADAHTHTKTHGHTTAWHQHIPPTTTPPPDLPTYPFQHHRYWLTPPTRTTNPAGMDTTDHPLLPARTTLADNGTLLLTGRISRHTHPWLTDHAVNGTTLLPATAFIELAHHAGHHTHCPTIDELTIHTPLTIPEHAAVQLQLSLGTPDEAGRRAVAIHSRHEHDSVDDQPWTHHATGQLTPDTPPTSAPTEWPPPDATPIDLTDAYDQLADKYYEYGPAFQGLTKAWKHNNDIYAEIQLPEEIDTAEYAIHPALLDAALHPLILTNTSDTIQLPFTWNNVTLHPTGASLRVHLERTTPTTARITATDDSGIVVATVESLVFQPIPADRLSGAQDRTLFEVTWQPIQLDSDLPAVRCAVLGDQLPGLTVDRYQDLSALHDAIAGAAAPDVVIAVVPSEPETDVVGRAHASTASTVELLRHWLTEDRLADSRLVLVTRGAVATSQDENVHDLGAAPIWGLVRTAQTESPGRFVALDLDDLDPTPQALVAAVTSGEPQLASRAGTWHAPRLTTPTLVPPATPHWHLDVSTPGTPDNLVVVPSDTDRPLGPGEIRLAVHAAGLNFRDVLMTLGMYPGPIAIGSEAAGTVIDTAADVTDLQPGDRVMGLVPHAFGPTAVTDRRFVAPVPTHWSDEQAATTPIVFLTAYYALTELARLQPHERILVHAATGGVGMAACQLARHLGATVHATAHPTKWHVLQDAGLDQEHIASSRTLDFAETFLAATDGAGVDVVLNSLAHEFVDASLRLLPRGGRFIEMGKTDIRRPEEVAERHPGVSYQAFDIYDAGQDRIQRMLTELGTLFDSGALTPLPVTSKPVGQARQAFRLLQEARHIGKIALTLPRRLDPEGTVLVTGGTGALGVLVARHLVARHGIRHLLLVSRSGPAAAGAAELRAELTGLGADVTIAACDAADREALAGLLDGIPQAHPLTAVMHTAGALDDATIDNLTPARLDSVLSPKIDAAWLLHELTADRDLAAFVLFSSVTGILGNPGQANYTAANTFLDALVHQRRAEGLAATSLSWGLWDNPTGMTRHLTDADHARLRRGGLVPLTPDAGLRLFDTALAADRPHLVPTGFDPAALRAQAAAGQLPAMLRGVVRAPARRALPPRTSSSPLADRLSGLSATERLDTMTALVRAEVATTLGHDRTTTLDASKAFKDLGFDSLTAVEFRNRLGAATELKLPTTIVFEYPTITELAGHLVERLLGAERATPAPASATAVDDPIAVVGMSCRYPGGVASPDDLWQLVANGVDAISEFPTNRGWAVEHLYDPDPSRPGKTSVRHGGFLHDADQFDPEFFGINPREAAAMDPQQRLLLETTWETFERAGITPESVRGTQVGVFVGAISQDYGPRMHESADGLDGYLLTGNTTSVVSGRIAYTFGLEGPAVTVDTACSSSLVATHLAVRALRQGECELALAGGATVMSTPGILVEFSRQRGLAPDGRCKTFAATADGTALAEGAGVLLLERLSDARRNGHQVHAVIRGSAINQDGASNGLTAPNGQSQEKVIRQALADSGLSSAEIDVIEAHGTGTALGDPIEAQAVLATYGQRRPADRPLLMGSVKSNIGHTQAAAGVAAMIKMIMALRNDLLPRSLHLDEPTPHVDWDSGAVSLLTDNTPWPQVDRPRRAAVSSFGISGTNAHLILEAPAEPPPTERAPADQKVVPWLLAARTEPALRAQAGQLLEFLDSSAELDPAEVGLSLATTRSGFAHRAAVLGRDSAGFQDGLRALAAGEQATTLIVDRAAGGRTAFLFSGQGSQRLGMGRELHSTSPVFAEAFDEVIEQLDAHLDRPLAEVMWAAPGSPEAGLLDQTAYTQTALFAVEVALFRLVEHYGVRADYLLGHSVGEIVAAHVSGVLSLPDAARLVAARGRLMQALPGGAMVSLQAGEDEVRALLAEHADTVGIAALNGPMATVVSGDEDATSAVAEAIAAKGRKTKRLRVSHAFHSPRMDGMLDEFRAVVATLTFGRPDIPIVANLTGELADAELLASPDYWVRHVREPVRFLDCVTTLVAHGATTFLELGPDAVLTAMAQDCLTDDSAAVVPLLRRDRPEDRSVVEALATTHVRGGHVDWPAFFRRPEAHRVDLPTYPFQRQRFWFAAAPTGDATGLGLDRTNHPLLSAAVDLGDRGHVFTGRLDTRTQPWLAEHAVLDTVLLPGTAFVEMALWAGSRFGCDLVDELTLQAPLVLPEGEAVQLQVSVAAPDDSGRRAIAVASRPEPSGTPGDRPWTRHADGVLAPDTEQTPTPDPSAWPPATAVPIDLTGAYDALADLGYQYGPTFQGLAAAWRDGADLYADVHLAQPNEFTIHPALLDAALHPLILGASASPQLPFSWSGVRLHAVDATALRVRISTANTRPATLTATDPTGAPVITIDGLVTRPVPADQLVTRRDQTSLYRVVWHEVPAEPVASGRWAAFGANDLDLPDVEVCDDLAAVAAAAPDVVLASVSDTDPHAATHRALGLVQDWLADERFESARLVMLTRGAIAATPADRIHDLAGSPLWGLVRTAQVEHPGRFVLLDVDEHGTSRDTVASVLATDDDQFAIRATRPHTPRLAPATPDEQANGLTFRDGTVLITGGTGALGALVARQLITHHDAQHIVLASRSGPAAAGAAALHTELTDLGTDVTIAACDAADRDALAELLATIPPRHPLTAIVHTAGTLDDGPVTALTPRQVDAVFESKVDAAWHLHELTKDLDLTAFLLFSSTAGVLGNPGQANYAAANTYLDALAHYRRDHGLVATSLSWGLWANATGMTQHLSQADHARLRRTGIAALTTEQALSHLSTALTATEPHLVPVRLDVVTAQASSVTPLLRDLIRIRRPAAHGAAANGDSWLERLRELPSTERQNALATVVRNQAATVLGHATPDAVDTARTFTDLGFDSLTAVEFRNRLNSATGLRLPTTLTFEYPTPVELVAHLRAELFGEQERNAPITAVLAELDRLDSAMSSVDPTTEDVTGIDTRLREILAKWSEIQNTSDNGDRDLDSATADDLLDIIHKEFGRS
jgi:acyl transferase domain-containing protein/NADPH:quinone reductase-like Zn-dependent oxidoreductase